jgi:LPS export ABC transporter protein LptC
VIKADRARAEVKKETIQLEGNVAITDAANRVLETNRASYDGRTEIVVAPGPVTIRGDNFMARGSSLTADLKARQVDVAGPMNARVEP